MAKRKAHARWQGGLEDGRGQVGTESGALREAAYSVASRFKDGKGTNPEELIGAAHAGCFAMALTAELGKAGYAPEYVDATASVEVVPEGGGFRITGSHLACEAKVPGIDRATFMKHAEDAKANCPVSKALGAIEISLEARLAG